MRHRIFPSLLSLSLALGLCVLPASALETDDLKTLLQTYYVDQVPENVLEQESVQAVLDALNDPYTTYMTAGEYQSFLNQVDGETVVGIGVSIQATVSDGVQILSVLEGSPAQEAGSVRRRPHPFGGRRHPGAGHGPLLPHPGRGRHTDHPHCPAPQHRQDPGLHPGAPGRGHPHRHL